MTSRISRIYCIFSFIGLLFCFHCNSIAQNQITRTFDPSHYDRDSLNSLYGHNKTLLPGYELPILLALAFYPELVDEKISFRFENLRSSGKTIPSVISFLKNNSKHFIISINNEGTRTGVLLDQIPFNAQVGLFGHELGHIIQMQQKSMLGMSVLGMRYLTHIGKKQIERQTDMFAIAHGLGWQLFDLTDFILKNSGTTSHYRHFKEKYYLHPGEISSFCTKNY